MQPASTSHIRQESHALPANYPFMSMTAKENALRIIHFDHPDYVMEYPPTHSLAYFGCNHEGFAGGGHDGPVGSQWTDIWGTVWHKELEGIMAFPRGNPLADIAQSSSYHWPDPDDERLCAPIYAGKAQFAGGDCFLAANHRDTLWEKSYMLVGMENMMIYLLTEPDYAREILHRVMDFQLGMAKHYLAAGVEFAHLCDDLGMQDRPLLHPALVQEFLVPEYARLCALYREHGVLIGFHSCGQIEWMLDTFMTLGVDVLNPVQASANDLAALRAQTQGRMALQGGVSSHTIMNGPVARIGAEVRERLWQLGRDGGYFCAADQWLPFPRSTRARCPRQLPRMAGIRSKRTVLFDASRTPVSPFFS